MLRSLASSLARSRAGASSLRWNVTRPSKRMLATEGSSQTYKAKREPLITPTMVLIGIMPIFTFALGTWQVQRLKWKVALIDELEEKLEREPMPLPTQINLAALPDFSFRKVVLKGRWDNAHAILLGPRVRDGTIGYHLVVPFVRTDGSTVLVDRGFVSKHLAQTAKQNQSTAQGEVEILGMLRTAQPRNSFTPDNHPDEGKWYWADVDAMAAHAGGEASGVQPVFIEEVFGPCWGCVFTNIAWLACGQITYSGCQKLARFVHRYLVLTLGVYNGHVHSFTVETSTSSGASSSVERARSSYPSRCTILAARLQSPDCWSNVHQLNHYDIRALLEPLNMSSTLK